MSGGKCLNTAWTRCKYKAFTFVWKKFEYFSEDPYLSSELAASHIKGVQSQGVGACLKHFAANNQEHRRMTVDTIVDERTLREIYLQALRML